MAPPTAYEELEETTAVAEPYPARWVPQQFYDPGFKQYVAGRLAALGELSAGWDGYQAAKPSHEIIDAARKFADRIPERIAPRPLIVPLTNGTIQFEWVSADRALEFEFESAESIHYLRWEPKKNIADEQSFPVGDSVRAESLMRWFTGADA